VQPQVSRFHQGPVRAALSTAKFPRAVFVEIVMLLFAAAGAAAAAGPSPARPAEITPGVVHPAVSCAQQPGNSYALYLPAGYTPQKKWPIMYAFDPGARGDVPVRLYKDVAEKYGYILAGSNNTQNFDAQAQSEGTRAMLDDTRQRFSVDRERIYTTGFSGGARLATLIALRCTRQCKIAGVIASGATYPATVSPSANDAFLYFIGIGDTDFNYPEIVQIRLAKERLASPYRLRIFAGAHQWSPAGVVEEAVAWFQLRGMQAGEIPRDEPFMQEQRSKALAEIAEAERAHDALRQWFAYRALTEDLAGLGNRPEVGSRLEALKRSPELKQALERERKDAEEQEMLVRDTSAMVARLAAGTLKSEAQVDARDSILSNMARLQHSGASAKDARKRRVYLRAFNALFAEIAEEGQRQQAKKKFSEALPFYEIAQQAAPDRAWPYLLLAEVQVALGDHKRALRSLQRAAETGRIDAEALERDAALASLSADPEFQAVVNKLKARSPSLPR
jgi:dienelactone hydrolase